MLAAITIVGFAFLAVGLASGYIKNNLYISEPLIFLVLGILIGPHVGGLVSVADFYPDTNALLKEVARVTVAISVMGAALRLPDTYFGHHWREMVVVLGGGMLLMWLVSSLLVGAFFAVPVLVAILIGAVITPTDPVLSDSIVTGRAAETCLPARMRNVITAEAGANDGLSLILVMLPTALLTMPVGEAWYYWGTVIILWEVGFAVVVGIAVGWIAGHALHWAHARGDAEKPSYLTTSLALTITVLALVRWLGSDGILAVFIAGLVFNRFVERREDREQERIQEAIKRFFELPVFVLFGMVLPWSPWAQQGMVLWGVVLAVLLLRRLPAWLSLFRVMPSLRQRRDVWFNGWFGPIGIAALFYATKAQHDAGIEQVWIVVSAVVFASIVLHGVTATPLTLLFGRRGQSPP